MPVDSRQAGPPLAVLAATRPSSAADQMPAISGARSSPHHIDAKRGRPSDILRLGVFF